MKPDIKEGAKAYKIAIIILDNRGMVLDRSG